MAYCKEMVHVVQQGDTFYRLAQHYHTTVPDIIMRNPGVNPYNLQIGTKLSICSGLMMNEPDRNEPGPDELAVYNDLRQAFMEQLFWIFMYLSDYMNRLPMLQETMERLDRTPEDITAVFENFYPQNTVNQMTRLLSQYNSLMTDWIHTMQDNREEEMEQLERQQSQNVDNMARYLSNANPQYGYDDLLKALTMYLNTTKRVIREGYQKNYGEQIRLFDENTNQGLKLADYLGEGLISQFYPS